METYLLEDETFLLYRFCIARYICSVLKNGKLLGLASNFIYLFN